LKVFVNQASTAGWNSSGIVVMELSRGIGRL
jgi:hypothetical protein